MVQVFPVPALASITERPAGTSVVRRSKSATGSHPLHEGPEPGFHRLEDLGGQAPPLLEGLLLEGVPVAPRQLRRGTLAFSGRTPELRAPRPPGVLLPVLAALAAAKIAELVFGPNGSGRRRASSQSSRRRSSWARARCGATGGARSTLARNPSFEMRRVPPDIRRPRRRSRGAQTSRR